VTRKKKDTRYDDLLEGLKTSKARARVGEAEFERKMNKIRNEVIDKLIQKEQAFGIFGMPERKEDAIKYLIESFDNRIEGIVKKVVDKKIVEYEKRKAEAPKCPVCGAMDDWIENITKSNNIFGPGSKSWVVGHECRKCGVRFGRPKGMKDGD